MATRSFKATARPDETGAFKNPRMELYALGLADDLPPRVAFDLASGDDKIPPKGADRRNYEKVRQNYEELDEFWERVNALKALQEQFLEDPYFGHAKWAAFELYMCSRAAGDFKIMKEAADLLFRCADRQKDLYGVLEVEKALEERKTEETDEKRPPGRPARENPQNKADASQMRDKLMLLKSDIDKTAAETA